MKTPTIKKESVLSLLKKIQMDISAIRSGIDLLVSSDMLVKSINETPKNCITVDFPSKTMKEIMKEYNNIFNGGKLLYNTDWYKNEDFFTKEKTREGTRIVSLELEHKGKSWNACNELKGDSEMLNPAEVIYLLVTYPEYQKVLKDYNYTWTSGRSSRGGFVGVGRFDSDGAGVDSSPPDYSCSSVGVSFSKIII